jgi:methylated-DNA-[protein]-cysteine S-methyltransferase
MSIGKSTAVFRTPLGWAGVAVSEKGVTRVVLPRKDRKSVEEELEGSAASFTPGAHILKKAVKLLERYFTGEAVVLDLPLDLGTETAFLRDVRKAAASIPSGETRSYGWVARRAGRPTAARAVGQVMAANPVPVLIP